jgi:hypothetical protein
VDVVREVVVILSVEECEDIVDCQSVVVVPEQGHSYSTLHRCNSGSNRDPKGQEYSVRIKDPLRKREHKKYVVQVRSLRLKNRPFSEQTNSSVPFCAAKQFEVVDVVEVIAVVELFLFEDCVVEN